MTYLDDKLCNQFYFTQLVHLFDILAYVSSPIILTYFRIYSRLKMVQFISFSVIVFFLHIYCFDFLIFYCICYGEVIVIIRPRQTVLHST
jgi:hypothetical protein